MIPNTWLKHPEIWESLLMSMNPTAMIRNLNKMTACGLIKPLSGVANFIATKLTDEETLKTARIHPFNVLVAQTTYKSGKGFRGDLVWTPVPQIISALEDAFYKSFKFIESANKRTLIGIDVSSSMCGSQIANTNVSAHVGATAMAMATVRREPQTHIFGFAHDFRELGISVNDSLQDAMRKTQSSAFGRTDCSLPMQYALTNKLNVDTFVVYTDNETYAGRMAPCQALALYRKESGIPAKLIVVGMTATRFTIADPKDSGMLDVVGFDSAAPSIIADFSAERF
jgi:60 kDa SS-A/Ro ribonucleoprotein